jgi:hypothetical protein
LRQLLNLEEQPEIDWLVVAQLCDQTIRGLLVEPAPDYPHDVVFHFLDDADVRQKDGNYASVQRDRLRDWLNSVP